MTVSALNADLVQIAETTTDINGNYGFTGLAPGEYRVQFAMPKQGYTLTPMNRGDDLFDVIAARQLRLPCLSPRRFSLH